MADEKKSPSNTTYVVLDTNAILAAPGALVNRPPGHEFVVPASVVEQIARSSATSGSTMPSLVAHATQSGNVVIPFGSPFRLNPEPTGPLRIDSTDRQVLATAAKLKADHPSSTVLIASDDRDIHTAADMLGLRRMSADDLRQLIAKAKADQPEQPVEPTLDKVQKSDRRVLIGALASGLVGFLVGVFGFRILLWLAPQLPKWGPFLIVLFGAPLLYRLRGRYRLAYGATECLFGFAAAITVAVPMAVAEGVTAGSVFSLMAGFYVMVRGFDNIRIGVQGRTYAPLWNRLMEPNK